ncbi:UbiD family decarboxylase [Affinibrenneria salicis]|uniref:UbiD family decarboxylase n=1 Tax=Affinibrenneria salicis TaxID=2590031 RepID=A0A5J5FT85_9GAMM|nr:UbiD family decarboxylase [Affinibrenneria salicis]
MFWGNNNHSENTGQCHAPSKITHEKNQAHDLRSAIELLKTRPGELVETDVEVDPQAERSGIYRYVGAGGACQRPPRKNAPRMMFDKIKGFNNISVAIGLNGSRKCIGQFPGCEPRRLGHQLKDAVQHPIAPPEVSADDEVMDYRWITLTDLIGRPAPPAGHSAPGWQVSFSCADAREKLLAFTAEPMRQGASRNCFLYRSALL